MTHVLTAVPVPLFLMISGYLYFNNIKIEEGLGVDTYKKKTWARIKSLLVPYLLWNFFVLGLFAVTQSLSGNSEVMQKDGYKLIADYDLIDYCKSFWALDSTGMPMDGPLWFIRDLFVISLFSPIVYTGVKYLKWLFVIILFALGFCGVEIPIPFIDYQYKIGFAEMYFTLGASFMLLDKNWLIKLRAPKFMFPIMLLAILGACGMAYTAMIEETSLSNISTYTYRILGSLLTFGIAERLVDRGCKIPEWLSTSSFFIFAMHKPVQVIVRRLSFAVLHPQNGLVLTSMIFIVPTIVICICLISFYIIRRYIPYLKCLNGYRL